MAPSQRVGGRADDRAQMMILAAVILLIGFIALAGMVARVSQLASQTTTENQQSILREVGPLVDSLNQSICRLKASTATPFTMTSGATVSTSGGVATVTRAMSDPRPFVAADIGMAVSGTGIPPGTRVVTITATTATLDQAPSAAVVPYTANNIRFTPCLAPGALTTFGLTDVSSPTLEAAVVTTLEQLQALQAQRGLFMDWEIGCIGGNPARGTVTASLWNGAVWVEVQSSVAFPRADCTSVTN